MEYEHNYPKPCLEKLFEYYKCLCRSIQWRRSAKSIEEHPRKAPLAA